MISLPPGPATVAKRHGICRGDTPMRYRYPNVAADVTM